MKKVLFSLAVLSLAFTSNFAEASVYNVTCDTSINTITYYYSGVYNHLWIHINGEEVTDRWTYSSGWGSYKPNPDVEYGDTVRIYYKDLYGYHWTSIAYCN